MSKSKRRKSNSQKGKRRSLVTLLAVICVVAIAAITVVSRQVIKAKTNTANVESGKKFVTVKVAGQDVQVDNQTGQIKPLTPQEAQQLAEGLKQRFNRSTAGLVEQRDEDGSVSLDLQGRFQSVVVARRNEDGTKTQSCIDTPQAAAAFFGIDPKLLGVTSSNSGSKTPVRNSPVKN
jgi:Na+-translocating ferredoxin:NAD+ oxidoreductase RnfG subunit